MEREFSGLPIRREKCSDLEIDVAKKMLHQILFYLTVIDLSFNVFGFKESTRKTEK